MRKIKIYNCVFIFNIFFLLLILLIYVQNIEVKKEKSVPSDDKLYRENQKMKRRLEKHEGTRSTVNYYNNKTISSS